MSRRRQAALRWLVVAAALWLSCVKPGLPPVLAMDSTDAARLLDRYERGEYGGVVAELAATSDRVSAFAATLKRVAPEWVRRRGPEDEPRRRMVVAMIALEAARALKPRVSSVYARSEEVQWRDRINLVEWACDSVRTSGPPTAGERWWHLAVVAFIEESAGHPFYVWESLRTDATRHLAHGQARFPGDPRLALAGAVIDEMSAGAIGAPLAMESGSFDLHITERPGADVDADVAGRYPPRDVRARMGLAVRMLSALTKDPAVGAEAHLRIGAIELFRGQMELAVPHFESAEARADEPFLLYLSRFFRGAALTRLQRADAEAAYRSALAVVPKAHSASVGLGWMLAITGRSSEAAAVINDSLGDVPRDPDPWALYPYGDARLETLYISRVRAELK